MSFDPPLPDVDRATVVVDPPTPGPGSWAGGPSVAADGDGLYLAYRMRRPIGEGRGYANVVARSDDGVHFETVAEVARDGFDCDSLERPALVATGDGRWRLYVSCATVGTKHWRVELLEADDPSQFDAASARVVLPGDDRTGVKDPVILFHGGRWHMWLCCHPLDAPDDTDRMWTRHATSADGVEWELNDVALAPRPGEWDSRGARVSAVLARDGRWFAYYDGRAIAADNAEERTGIAVGDAPGCLVAWPGPAASSPYGRRSLRYVAILELPDGGFRLYYEASRRDGAHDLRTEYVPPTR